VTYARIACCVECDAHFLPKAQYAITSLLRPIRLEPRWVDRSELGDVGIYYGPFPNSVEPGVLAIPLDSSTQSYFGTRESLRIRSIARDDKGIIRLFPVDGSRGISHASNILNWDPFASAFYFLSGWQEWVSRVRDVHGRFPYAQSTIAEFNLAHDPMVDRYRRYVRHRLEALGLSIRRRLWNGRESAVCITHDVDYHRKFRPGILYGEMVSHVLKGEKHGRVKDTARFASAIAESMLRGDPFRRSLDAMNTAESVLGLGSTWFFKAGAHGLYDTDYALESGWIADVIDHLEKAGFEIGLHPSYFAADHPRYLESEHHRLQRTVSGVLQSVRSHYLRWFPDRTPRMYADAGFFIDSTLGFAEQEGFRNGTTVPFRVFDLERNHPLDLWEMPVAVMDTTIYGYRDLELQDGIDVTRKLLGVTKEFGGVLVLLWHNIMLDKLGDPRIAPHFSAITDGLDTTSVYVASLRDALSVWLDQTAATTIGDE